MLKKVILITGSNGEIGQSLIKTLNKKKIYNIIALDLNRSTKHHKIENFIQGSVLNKQLLKKINNEYHLLEVYHLAAILSTKAEQNPNLAKEVNIQGTSNLLNLALITLYLWGI